MIFVVPTVALGLMICLKTANLQELDEHSSGNSVYRGSSHYSFDYETDESILGKPGRDYPSHSEIPKTGFSCKGRIQSGYYADVETDCQVFHICVENNHKISFLCPSGSVFNQKVLVCDWWYRVDCRRSAHDDFLNGRRLLVSVPDDDIPRIEDVQYDDGYDLNLAQSGGNENPATKAAKATKVTKVIKVKQEPSPPPPAAPPPRRRQPPQS